MFLDREFTSSTVEYWIVSNETNTDVCRSMYTWRIYSSSISLLCKDELIWNGNYTGIYTNVWIDIRHVRIALDIKEKWELHSVEKLWYWDLKVGNAISMFVSQLAS